MTVVGLAAELIRRATNDPSYELILYQAAEGTRFEESISDEDLDWLSPGEWTWFAEWRLSVGWRVGYQLLSYLDQAASSIEMRDRLLRIAFRDAAADQMVGTTWLAQYSSLVLDRPRDEQRSFVRAALQDGRPPAMAALRALVAENQAIHSYATVLAERCAIQPWPDILQD